MTTRAPAGDKPGPSSQHAAFRRMAEDAVLPRLLREGTRAMRESKDWTPKSPGESENAYKLRLSRSFLLGSYVDICETVVDALFSPANAARVVHDSAAETSTYSADRHGLRRIQVFLVRQLVCGDHVCLGGPEDVEVLGMGELDS